MSKIILCVGNYANTPYLMEDSNLKLYSIEELCYFLCDNVVFLDQNMFNRELIAWIDQECGLSELAKELSVGSRKKEPLQVSVDKVLKSVHYCSEKERREIGQQILESASMNIFEKRKSRADFYYRSGKYLSALKEYENLRRDIGENDPLLKSRVSHDIGVMYAKLYFFDKAAENFLAAFECGGNTESYLSYLAAKRILLEEDAYVNFIAEEDADTGSCMELEHKMETLDILWKNSAENAQLLELKEWKNGKHAGEYYESVEDLVNSWEDTYRDNTLNL